MKLRLSKIGKPSFKEAQSWVGQYEQRLKGFCQAEFEVLKDQTDPLKLIAKSQSQGGYVVALDERGSMFSSRMLADKIQSWTDDPQIKHLHFIIGGPYGLGIEGRSKAQQLWGLSPLTMQGDLAWTVATEQLYRAFNILKGTGYHHE